MNENAVVSEEFVDADSLEANGNIVSKNFFVPDGVDVSTLTLENYLKLTGKRFRMTKDQSKIRGLSREEAFAESKAFTINQLGGN